MGDGLGRETLRQAGTRGKADEVRGQDRLQAKRAGDRTGLQSLEPSNRMRLQRSIGCLREAPYLCGRATQAWQARDWRRCNTTRCQEPRQGPTNTETGVAGARLFLWLEDHERGRQLPCKTRGLTFELTPRAEAGGVSPVRDDATPDADRAYTGCRSTSGVERGVRPR